MSENKSAYRQIMKATSIFGGVQVFNILISIIRSKVVAIFLGPAGMGIVGLLNSTIGLMSSLTNFGLSTSAVKSISSANTTEDNQGKLALEVSVLHRLIWYTGIFGTLLIIVLSSWLSQLTFGNSDYTFAFIWISITLLFKQLTEGNLAVLQGLRNLKLLAKANMYGSFFGLLFTVPLYYYLRIESIVPAIIMASLIALLSALYFSSKIKIKKVTLTNSQTLLHGKIMVKLGLSLSFISMLTILSGYILQIVISHKGGIVEVGLFSAGFALINTYVGLIFSAISTDYFPRLVVIVDDNKKIRTTVVQQAIIAVLVITPIIILFLTFAPLIIRILYSLKFVPIISMVSWGILGMLFKAASWTMGYILIAKGDSKLFIKTSIFFNSLFLVINIVGYYWDGLQGLGITFALNFIIHFLCLKIITLKRYDFYFDKEFNLIFLLSIFLCVITFIFTYILNPYLKYSLLAIMAIISLIYTLYQLDKKMNFKELFLKIKK